jgi:EAL domain-containing protein (putative c-di-GMP-specific phosphodiesterase class I)/GGDEF domain-containing protein
LTSLPQALPFAGNGAPHCSRQPDDGAATEFVRNLHRLYRAIASQASLAETLEAVATEASAAADGATAVVFRLEDGLLRTSAAAGPDKAAIGALPPLLEPRLAPWWRWRGKIAAIGDEREWAAIGSILPGLRWCWSDRLETAAGEVAGCLTLFGSGVPPGAAALAPLAELKQAAVLAIEQANLLEELRYRAEHDPATGLWNRDKFQREVAGRRAGGCIPAGTLLLVACDGVRRVREILGEESGDALLREVVRRIGRLPGEPLCGRLSGDELVLLLPSGSSQDPLRFGDSVLSALREPALVDGHEFAVHAAVGLARERQGEPWAEWLRRARAAAAAARLRTGAGRCVEFDDSLTLCSPERLELERRLRGAAARGELQLYYQPQVRTRGGGIAGYEALMRWRNPEIGTVSPAAFIPVAEETGLIVELGRWALGEACRQARSWQREGLPARVGVNVSAVQLAESDFPRHVEQALAASGLPPSLLELEITESMVMQNRQLAAERMRGLRRLGVEFALDDFGTGSSSLAYLKDLPVQRLKVDRSFLAELERASAPLLESIIRLAHQLGLGVIVEGVETPRQLELLAAMGADEIQGYLTGRPVPAGEAARQAVVARQGA